MSVGKRILDTNIVSYLMKGGALAEAYKPHVQNHLLAISFITVGELYFGAEKRSWGEIRRKKLESTLHKFVIIPYDHKIARCYGRLVAERQRAGRPIAPNDAWIAACTVRHAVPLVTHNAKDFQGITALHVVTESASTINRNVE